MWSTATDGPLSRQNTETDQSKDSYAVEIRKPQPNVHFSNSSLKRITPHPLAPAIRPMIEPLDRGRLATVLDAGDTDCTTQPSCRMRKQHRRPRRLTTEMRLQMRKRRGGRRPTDKPSNAVCRRLLLPRTERHQAGCPASPP